MRTHSRIRTSAAVALIAALTLGGCSSSDSAGDSDTGSDTTTTDGAPSSSGVPADGTDNAESGGSGTSSGAGSADTADGSGTPASSEETQAPAGTATSVAPAVVQPTATVTNQACKSAKLTITLTANYDNSYRKGIKSVTLERQNEYNAWLDYKASWLGPETGQGNQWTGQLVGNRQNIGKVLRVTVTPTGGSPLTFTTPVTAPC